MLLLQLPFSYAVSVCNRAGTQRNLFFTRLFSFAFCQTWRFPPLPDEQLNMYASCRAASSSCPESPLSASSFGALFVWPPRALIHLVSCAAMAAGGGRVRPDDGGGHRRGGAPRALHHRRRGGGGGGGGGCSLPARGSRNSIRYMPAAPPPARSSVARTGLPVAAHRLRDIL